jgi:HlyD family type I secretion membrane fusion protein
MDTVKINPKKTICFGVIVLLFFFGGLGGWSYFFPMTGAVIAPGTVKVVHEKKTVQHLEGGIIDKILIKEGDIVKKGDLLMRLKSSRVGASISLIQGQIWFKLAEQARLTAENSFQESILWPQKILNNLDIIEVSDALKLQTGIFNSRKSNLKGKIHLYHSQIDQLQKKIVGTKANLNAQINIIESLAHEIKAKEELFKDRYIDEVQILELKRKLSERKGNAGNLEQIIAETNQKVEEMKLRIVDMKNTYQEEATTQLSKISDTIFELQERMIPFEDEKTRLEIQAPIDGEIINLKFHSEVSGIIRPGEPIVDIVPKDAKLLIEAMINKIDIAKVHEGQETKVQLTAFNRRTVPPLPGKVIYISGDQINKETQMGMQSFYIAHVVVDKDSLEKHEAYLSPGMPAVCFITTEIRTVIEYLLEPILEVLDYALKESG